MSNRREARRPWIKLYTIDSLDGSIRYQLEPEERSVWYDLLLFSAICAKPGIISDKDGRAYPMSFVANRLNIPPELLAASLKKCEDEGRVKIEDGVITIVNWSAYQSEYERQKPYRLAKKTYCEVVLLTADEHKKLLAKFGESGLEEKMLNLALYIQSKGAKYKSHYYTILNWNRKDGQDNGRTQKTTRKTATDEERRRGAE